MIRIVCAIQPILYKSRRKNLHRKCKYLPRECSISRTLLEHFKSKHFTPNILHDMPKHATHSDDKKSISFNFVI